MRIWFSKESLLPYSHCEYSQFIETKIVMKILQQIVLSAALATSMVAFSTSTIAAEKKEAVSVQTMIEETISHVEAALAAANAGESKEIVLSHIKEARQKQKDIIVGALDQERQKASAKLVNAGRDVKEGKAKEAKVALEQALAAYKELLVLSNAK
jgi:hypothetical protein